MGKNCVESSLKRFLKRKVKITMGFVVAFMIMGTGVFATESTVINKAEIDINELNSTQNGGKKDFVLDDNVEKLKITGSITYGDSNTSTKAGISFNLDLKGKDLEANLSRHEKLNPDVKEHGYFENVNITNGGTIIVKDILREEDGTKYDKNSENLKHWALNSGVTTEWTVKAEELIIEAGKTGIKVGNNYQKNNLDEDEKNDIKGIVHYNVGNINITSKKWGIYARDNSEFDIETNNILLTTGEGGILTESNGKTRIEGRESLVINSGTKGGITLRQDADGDDPTSNDHKIADGLIDIKGFENIIVKSDSEGVAINNSDIYDYNGGTINIEGKNVNITGKKSGIYVKGVGTDDKHSTVNISGTDNLKISATGTEKNAVKVTDGGSVSLENSKNLILDGNIDIAGSKNLKADINADFTSETSHLDGYIKTGNNAVSDIEFSNEAVWNNTGNSNVTNLTFDNGIINNTSAENNISVGTLYGNGGKINMAAYIDDATGEAVSGEIKIGKIENNNAHFDINYKGDDNLEISQEEAKEVFDKLTDNITVGEGELKADVKLEEGFIKGGYTADLVVDKNGSQVGTIDYELNSMVEGMRDLATINLLTWRQEMNSLNKRMGELRNSTGEHGVWSRVYTGKIENGSKYDNDYQTYQVGYDKKYTVDNGVMFVGGLVSYTDGETDYALGHGENYSVGAGIYATWLNNDGQFADVVLKQSRLHNKFDVRSKDGNKSQSGDYNNWGTSLSGQYGRRFDLNDKFFVEPSVELTLGRVEDTTYTTSAGVDVHQDTMYSLVGNVGTSVGYKFSDKGNVYARAALVKEFQGDIDTEYEKDGALERTSEDLGDTWAEFGVGVNYRFVENMNVYVDIQKTGEATVDNKWQANLGFRYEF